MLREVGKWLGYAGAILSGIAYIVYGTDLLRGGTDTNIVTWALWSVESLLNFQIYRKQVKGDFAKYAEELAASIGCVTITILICGRAALTGATLLGPVEWQDGITALLAIIVLVVYRRALKRGNVWPATLTFQALLMFSALPLARSTLANPAGEPFWPWAAWATGFFLQCVCVFLRRDDKRWYRELLTPVNYLFWHALIATIVLVYVVL